jgi:hypothetical protein
MRRTLMLLTVAVLMAAMLVAMAAPAMAAGSGGVVGIIPLNNNLIISPQSTQTGIKTVSLPTDPVYPTDPISGAPRNPNIFSELPCDGC